MQKQSPFSPKLLLLLLLCVAAQTTAQAQVYPGDANNDGSVNHFDILYIGYAYGSQGPVRPERNEDFSEIDIPLLWTSLFPDSTNFAFADSDGSGLVDFGDFFTVIRNYGSKRVNPQPTFLPAGIPNFDPQVQIGAPTKTRPIIEGDSIYLPILLVGPFADTLESVNGIAFTLEYDRRFFREIYLDFSDSWLGQDSSLFTFQQTSSSKLEVAATRYGPDPVRGKGKMAALKGIIEDDVIGFLMDSIQTKVKVNYIKMVDGRFRTIPTAGSEQTLIIYDTAMAVPVKETPLERLIQIFPNPTSDILQIQTPIAMQRVEIFNLQGQRLAQWELQAAYSMGLSLANQSSGIFIIKVHTEKGILTQKIMIQ